LEKEIYLSLDVILGSEELYLNQLSEGSEFEIHNQEFVITVNNVPYYKGKLIKKDGVSIIKILKIFSDRESSNVSEKYYLGV